MQSTIAGKKVTVEGVREPVTIVGPGVCRRGVLGCRGWILWARTASGRAIPLDPEPNERGAYVAHWTTCPHADHFRKSHSTSQMRS